MIEGPIQDQLSLNICIFTDDCGGLQNALVIEVVHVLHGYLFFLFSTDIDDSA